MKFFKIAAMTALVSGVAVGAHAATLTETGTVAQSKTDFSTVFSVTGGPTSSTFGFNSALGTLTSIVVTFATSGQQSGTLTNTSAGTQTFSYTPPAPTISLSSSSSAITAGLGSLVLTGPTMSYTLASGSTTSILPTPDDFVPVLVAQSYTVSSAAALAAASSFSLTESTLTGSPTFVGGGGNINSTVSTQVGGSVSVSFNYTTAAPPVTTVPEPSTLAVLGAGLVGLGFIRRRKAV